MPLNGECMCGGVKVTVQDQPADKPSFYCHCLNCKKQSGASGTLVMLIPDDEVKVEGTTKIYEDRKADSGTLLHRVFCENCGCPVYSKTEHYAGTTIIKMGLFDACPKPAMEGYTRNKQSWETEIVEGCPQIPGAP